jgi:hypothetical protein
VRSAHRERQSTVRRHGALLVVVRGAHPTRRGARSYSSWCAERTLPTASRQFGLRPLLPEAILRVALAEGEHRVGKLPTVRAARVDADNDRPVATLLHVARIKLYKVYAVYAHGIGSRHARMLQVGWDRIGGQNRDQGDFFYSSSTPGDCQPQRDSISRIRRFMAHPPGAV